MREEAIVINCMFTVLMEGSKYLMLNTGAKIPRLGLGTLRSQDNVKDLVKTAIMDCGYRHIDTARDYENEEAIGEGLAELISKKLVLRTDLFVTTKIYNHEKQKGNVVATLQDSLKKLRLDYVDLFLIHWPIGAVDSMTKKLVQTPLHETWAEMEACFAQGLCKAIGVSNFGVQLLLDLISYAQVRPAVNQIEQHPYLVQCDLVSFCQSQGIVVEAYSPLGSAGTADWRPVHKFLLEDPLIQQLAVKYGKSAAQVCLSWGLSRGCVVLPKTSRKERLAENMQALDFTMSSVDLAAITALNQNWRCFDTKYWDSTLHIPIFA